MNAELDRRVAMVESNYVSVFDGVRSPLLRRHPDSDVLLFTSDLPLPLFSGAIGPRFAPGAEAARSDQVLGELVANGQPFHWWFGPLTRSEAVEDLLARRGLVSAGPAPGMHADLATVELPAPHREVRVERCESREQLATANAVLTASFGIQPELAAAFVDVVASVDGSCQLLATVDGVAVGCAAGVVADGVMGVYNVGTLPQARRRGVGAAVTAALMRLGRELGCHSSILHASELGYPVYRALGYEHVTEVTQYVWLPADEEAPAPRLAVEGSRIG